MATEEEKVSPGLLASEWSASRVEGPIDYIRQTETLGRQGAVPGLGPETRVPVRQPTESQIQDTLQRMGYKERVPVGDSQHPAGVVGVADPYGKAQHEAGAKLDKGKADCSLLLLFGRALEAVADVGTFGARKYSRGGWQHVPDGINRYTAAMLRQLWDEDRGSLDADSGLQHAAQVAWNALARLELILREQESK